MLIFNLSYLLFSKRPTATSNTRSDVVYYKSDNAHPVSPGTQQIAVSNPVSSRRIQSPLVATPALKVPKEAGDPTSPHKNGDNILKDGQVVITNGAGFTQQAVTVSKGVAMAEVMQPGKVLSQRAVVGKYYVPL